MNIVIDHTTDWNFVRNIYNSPSLAVPSFDLVQCEIEKWWPPPFGFDNLWYVLYIFDGLFIFLIPSSRLLLQSSCCLKIYPKARLIQFLCNSDAWWPLFGCCMSDVIVPQQDMMMDPQSGLKIKQEIITTPTPSPSQQHHLITSKWQINKNFTTYNENTVKRDDFLPISSHLNFFSRRFMCRLPTTRQQSTAAVLSAAISDREPSSQEPPPVVLERSPPAAARRSVIDETIGCRSSQGTIFFVVVDPPAATTAALVVRDEGRDRSAIVAGPASSPPPTTAVGLQSKHQAALFLRGFDSHGHQGEPRKATDALRNLQVRVVNNRVHIFPPWLFKISSFVLQLHNQKIPILREKQKRMAEQHPTQSESERMFRQNPPRRQCDGRSQRKLLDSRYLKKLKFN